MQVKAQHKNARMSPRKIRILRGVVKGLPVAEAQVQLQYMPGKAARLVLDVLNSAMANAVNNFEASRENLKVADVVVDGALTMKRIQPVSKGMAHGIIKRMSHITVVVEETGEVKKKIRKGKKKENSIETITTDQLIKQGVSEEASVEVEDKKEKKPKENAAPRRSKSEESFQKTKMQQLGGDRAKTSRRKSLKGGD